MSNEFDNSSMAGRWVRKQEFLEAEALRCGITPAGVTRRMERGVYGSVQTRLLPGQGGPVELMVSGPLPPDKPAPDGGFIGHRVCECGKVYKFRSSHERLYGCPDCRSVYSNLELARTRKGIKQSRPMIEEYAFCGPTAWVK
jgi:hypothetical protein